MEILGIDLDLEMFDLNQIHHYIKEIFFLIIYLR